MSSTWLILTLEPTYTALSNSVVGILLLAGGIFGILAQWLGIGIVLALFALMAGLAVLAASRLDEVQVTDQTAR